VRTEEGGCGGGGERERRGRGRGEGWAVASVWSGVGSIGGGIGGSADEEEALAAVEVFEDDICRLPFEDTIYRVS